ncbi:MAG: hypothetical protein ACXAD7_13720 [Candidatus Kariarchaeaceae archaeon]|jgi:hypothetical protein
MAFNDDELRKELFKKVGAETVSDPLQQLNQGVNEIAAGNHAKGKELIQSVINQTGANAKRYDEQKQHRSAAEQYYIQALAYEKFEATDERDKNYHQVIESLLEASKTAINFGEDERGITAVTIAGLVCLMLGNETRAFEIYNGGIQTSEQKPKGEILKKLLFSLGYLLDGLRNTNIAALTDAQNFISTDLKPMLSSSKLLGFETLLNSVVSHTRDILESRIKMPKIQIGTQIPRDMLFNTQYDIMVNIANAGEGEATDVKLELSIPEDIEIIEGSVSESLGDLQSNSNFERSISIRLLTGEGDEILKEMSGHVSYSDMLQNVHKQSLGVLELQFRSVSKSSEYNDKLAIAMSTFRGLEEKVAAEIPAGFKAAITQLSQLLENDTENSIKAEEFEIANHGLIHIETMTNWTQETLVDGETAKRIVGDIKTQVDDGKNQLREELFARFNMEKTEALETQEKELLGNHQLEVSNLKSSHELEKEKVRNETKETLENQFKEEKNKLKEEQDKEIKNLEITHENKVRQQLTQQESNLTNDHKAEILKKNDEIEKAIRDMQAQQVEEMTKVKEEVRDEISKKYDENIAKVQSEFDEERRKLVEADEEGKESELKTLRSKMIQEREDALEAQLREIETKHAQDIAEKVDNMTSAHNHQMKEKDAKIQELETKLRDFTSSVDPM